MHILDQLGNRQRNLPPRLHAADLLRKLRHKSLEDVGAGQNHGDRIAAELVGATAGRIEHRFEFVRELLQHIELHHPDVALERVKCPEERIDRGGIGRIHFQHQHSLLDVLQEILRLGTEQLQHLGIGIGRHNIDGLFGKGLCSNCGSGRRMGRSCSDRSCCRHFRCRGG